MNDWLPNPMGLSWAGGLWDGEGSLGLNAHKDRPPTLQASMQQNHPEVLDKFCQIVGIGKVYGPYERKPTKARPTANPYYLWAIGGSKIVPVFFDRIVAYIGTLKREQGVRAIAQWKELNDVR